MPNLEILIKNLPKIVYSLKLTLGNSQEIMQQVVLINNAQEQLRQIQQAIAPELSFVNNKGSVIHTSKSYLLPSVFRGEIVIGGNPRLITEKFGNPEVEISLSALQAKIDSWIEWGDFLQAIAADILSDANLVNQINIDITYPNLATQIQNIENNLNINLVYGNRPLLQRQIDQIAKIEAEIVKVQNRLAYVVNTIKHSQGLLTILLAASSFCGKSGFSIEWLDDAHELIISSEGRFQELTDILNDCENFQDKITELINKSKNLKQQVQKQPTRRNRRKNKSEKINKVSKELDISFSEIASKALVIAVSISALGLSSWFIKGQINQYHQTNPKIDPETQAANNLKSALKLGKEASALAEDPPHTLTVWEQAASKWQEAIKFLESIPPETSASVKAQERLVRYRRNYVLVKEKAAMEKQALTNIDSATKLATEASFFIQSSPNSLLAWQQAKDKWSQAIQLLEAIPKNSAVYQQAQATLPKYKTNYAAINAIIENRVQSVN